MAKVKRRRYPRTKAGVELTPEIINALADEAERGYDLSKAKREYVGRPPLADGETSPRIAVRVTNDQLNQLRKRAEAEERSLSELARDALARYLDSE
jgi:hypothetical protein